MTTETESENTATQQDEADANAAFEAGFQGKEIPPATAKQPADEKTATKDTTTDGAKEGATTAATTTEATQATTEGSGSTTEQGKDPASSTTTGTEAATTQSPSPKTDDADVRAELRKVYGRIGALTDEIKQLKTTKEAEGKPAAATPVELARLRAEYPDLAEVLTEDLAKALGGLAQKGSDPKELEELVNTRVQEGVAREAARLRDAAVDDAHPTWRKDLFTEDPATKAKKPTADYLAWRATLGEQQAQAFESSTNPYHVIRELNKFYEWKGKAAKVEAEKQNRLKAAVTPQGVQRPSPPNLSDDEAMRKGFEEGFNS